MKFKPDNKVYFKNFLDDLTENECTIKAFVGDNQKRAMARDALRHSALFPCEYCFSRGVRSGICLQTDQVKQEKIIDLQKQQIAIEEQIFKMQEEDEEADTTILASIKEGIMNALKDLHRKKSHIVWPSSTMEGEPRTKEKILGILQHIAENNGNVSKEEAKGIAGKSPLLDIPYFNIIKHIPTEYLHSVCLGITKKLIELTFNVGISRKRITKRKLSNPSTFNDLMSKVKVFKECSRRARSLDFSVMKGQEYRNIVLFFFPLVVQCIEPKHKERKLWLLLAYKIRACTLPNKEFQSINLEVIEYCCKEFYKLYESLFSIDNCTYNTHVVCSHLLDMRDQGPLTHTSAFSFESFYGEVRHAFVPGTPSTLKQIMTKIFLKRQLSYHCCAPSMTCTNYETDMERNNLIYTYIHQTYEFYRIVEVEDDVFLCKKIEKQTHKFPETPTLKWEKVGLFKVSDPMVESNVLVKIPHNSVAGKLIKVQNLMITCSKNVLDEK